SGAGAGAVNTINADVKAFIEGDTAIGGGIDAGIQAAGVSLLAEDTSRITAITAATSLAASVSLAGGLSISVGVSVAHNEISNEVSAAIISADNGIETTSGDITINAVENATIKALTSAASLAIGLAGGTGAAVSGAGATSTNIILTKTNAYVSGSTINSARDVVLEASDNSSITAIVASSSAALAAGALAGVGVSIGASIARNLIGHNFFDILPAPAQVQAYISNSTVTAQGVHSQTATANETISAIVFSGSAAAAAGIAGVAVSGSGVVAVNKISTDVKAYIDNSEIEAGSIALTASDTSQITADGGAAAISAAFGGVGVAISTGVAIAENRITNNIEAYITSSDSVKTDIGDISVRAFEDATITARTAAAAVSAAVGSLAGIAISGSGAEATNIILTDTNAFVSGSSLVSKGDVVIDADNTSTIEAMVISAAASLAVGIAGISGSIGESKARNFIGWDLIFGLPDKKSAEVQAYISNSSVDAKGDLNITADAIETINASVFAGSVAVSAGLVAGAASAAGAVLENRVGTQVRSYIANTTGSGVDVDGNITITAHDTSTISALAGATSVAASVGAVAASVSIGLSIAVNNISNTVEAYVKSSTVDSAFGGMTIEAIENATITASSIAASAAVSAGIFSLSVSGGGGLATNNINTMTKAYVSQSGLNIAGDLNIHASDTSTTNALSGTSSVAAGLFSMSMGGSIVTGTIISTTEAYINNSNVTADDIVVTSNTRPKAEVSAYGVNAGTLSVGVSSATANVSTMVNAFVGGAGNTIIGDSLTVAANQLKPSTGYSGLAKTTGSAGGLIGIDATISNVTNTGNVTSYVKDGTILYISGGTVISANSNTRQKASANANAVGLVAAGISAADVTTDTDTRAYLGSGVNLTGGSLTITASGNDNNFADTVSGSVGGLSVAAATADTTTDSTTIAEIRGGSGIDLTGSGSGAFEITADHTSAFNGRIRALAGGLIGGAGADIDNSVTSDVTANVGNNVNVLARDISMEAVNRASKKLSGANIDGEAYGIVAGGSADSESIIDFTTLTTVGDNTSLEVVGDIVSPGEFKLKAYNDLDLKDKVNFTAGGGLSGLGAYSTIETENDLARVEVGNADLKSVGAINISARGEGEVSAKANGDAYGVGTVIVGETKANVSPTNEVIIGSGAYIRALNDLNISTGTSVNFVRDDYTVTSRFDSLAGSAIPIDDIDAKAYLFQENTIVIEAGAVLETARSARIHAEQYGYGDMTGYAKAVNWVSSISDALNGSAAEEMVDGVIRTEAHGTVQMDGTVRTGIMRHWSLTLDDFDRTSGDITASGTVNGGDEKIGFRVSQEVLQSDLVNELSNAQSQLAFYQDGTNATLINYYQSEVDRLEDALLSEGLLAGEDGDYAPVEQYVMTVHVDPVWA
ncbi:MAG: hypothetical protein HN929_13545, partial [Chloroflexi bacterium]|nr:hypothetical protein [Chloroflexota bacterium]